MRMPADWTDDAGVHLTNAVVQIADGAAAAEPEKPAA